MRLTALDPQAAAVLARLAANGGRPLHEQTPAEARLGAYGFLELFGPGEQVASVEHRFIPGPTADLPVRIYTPVTGCAPFPALVSFHGSGFVISNIGVFDAPNRALANRTGCIVVAVNYQKAPEHRFPVPFDDAYAATQWVFVNNESGQGRPQAVRLAAGAAVELLRKVDAKLSASLKRALDRKTQAGYESVDISAADAASCVRWAEQLLTAAKERLQA